MRSESSVQRFVAAPVGRYMVRRSFAIWCPSATLFGCTFWGIPNVDEAKELVALWELDRGFLRYDTFLDATRVRWVDHGGFGVLTDYLKGRTDDYAARVRRQVILLPDDEISGAMVAGLPSILAYRHEWRAFTARPEALAWLANEAAAAACDEMDQVVGEAIASGDILLKVRARLAEEPSIDLVTVARSLGCAGRSVQRNLELVGTSFRTESRTARIRAAALLLADSELKVEAVAREVGYTSTSNFNKAFRQVMGTTPLEYRAARRS